MLSFKDIEDCFPDGAVSLPDGWTGVTTQWLHDFAKVIEAAVLPEGLVAVPKEPTLAMLDCLRSDITSNLEKRYQAMLAAAPKAQASPLDLMECLQDRPVEPSKAVQGKCVVQSEKQEPVKDKPDFFVVVEETGAPEFIALWPEFCHEHINRAISEFDIEGAAKWKVVPLYTRPQPDLTAEVERLRHLSACEACIEIPSVGEYVAQCENRIAELEEAAREARDALQYHTAQTRPIFNTTDAIIKLDAVLGNAEITGGVSRPVD